MSCSKYASTPQTTNLARVSRLILGPCADVMRDVLLQEVPTADLSKRVGSCISSQKRNKKLLNQSQTNIIFPSPSNNYTGDYSDMDISLLYILLRNVTNLPAHSQGWGNDPDPTDRSISANIERLRLIRNKYYGHAVQIGIPDADFQTEFSNIRKIVEEADNYFGVCKYQQSVDYIKTGKMDPEQEIKWIKRITILDSLVSDVEVNTREIQELKNMNTKAKIETTTLALDKQREYISDVLVKTRAMNRVLELLEKNRFVIIKGNPGAGKTTIAMHVLTELQKKGMFPLQIKTINDLYAIVPPLSNVALFLDDLFGVFSVSNEVDDFNAMSHLIKAMCHNDNTGKGNIFIVTIRTYIYKEATEMIQDSDLFSDKYLIDISTGEFQLLNSEIRDLFTKYNLDKLLVSNSFSDVIEIGNTFGIPQCCFLLKKNPTFSEEAQAFLKDPIISLEKYIKHMLLKKDYKMAVLVYILLCGGSVGKNVLEDPQEEKTLKQNALKMIGAEDESLMLFSNCIYHYCDFLMTFDTKEGKYKFNHSSVQDSLFKCLIAYFPSEIIKSCDFTLLERLSTCTKQSWNSVKINKNIFQNIINRILEMLEKGSIAAFRTISRLQIWEDEKFVCKCENDQSVLKGLKERSDCLGQTMLVHFSISGNIRWVKYLLSSASEKHMYMALNKSCAHNQRDIVDLLLSTNVKYDLKTCFYAVQSGNLDILCRFTDIVDLHKRTFSNHFCWNKIQCGLLHEICFFGKNHLIGPVLERYPQLIDVRDNQGGSALHFVAYAGDETIFKRLVQSGCDPYRTSDMGSTVLSYACQNGKLNMVKYICEKYPDLLSPGYDEKKGMTPLHWSAQSGNRELYEYLKEKCVKQTFPDGQSTPLHEACRFGRLNMCEYLINTYPHIMDVKDKNGGNALHDAAWGGNIDLLKFLLEKGFNIEDKRNEGKTLLHQCCRNGKLDMSKFLINTYPCLLGVKDNNGGNALHDAAVGGNIDLFKFLLEKGFNIEIKRNDGRNVLLLCCANGNLEMCRYLDENYPCLAYVRDNYGGNALHDATCSGNIDLFQFLIEKNFDIETKRNDGKTVLHLGCMNKKLDMSQYLVNTYPHLLHVKDNVGMNALHAAASGGNVHLFQFLIEKGSDMEAKRNDGKTVLHTCCENGNLELCTYLCITYPYLLDVKDNYGMNVLHSAAWGGNIDLLNFLIDKDFDIEAKRKDGKTVLHLCCMNGKQDMCQYLLNAYPSLQDVKDNVGRTVLHDAAWGGNVDLFQFLIEKGFDIKAKSNDGETVIHLCCENGNLKLCTYLCLTYPQLLDVKDNNGMNVLHAAAWGGNIDLLNFLIEKVFDIEAKRKDGKTVLHLCCMNGKQDMCQYLLNAYPSLQDVKDNNGINALHDAAWGGNVHLFQFLMEKDFDIEAKINDGKTVLHICCANGNQELCAYLCNIYPYLLDVKDNNGMNVLHSAVVGGNIDILNFLKEKDFDIQAKRNDGKTVLHLCCMSGKLDMCQYLINAYPRLLHVKDNVGGNVLHAAAWGGNIDVLNFLIDKDFDIEAKRKDGKTVLHLCCMNGKQDMCQYLLNAYPSLQDVKDNIGRTVLHDAAWGGNFDLFQFLIEKGFDIEAKSNDGKTVIHLCCENGNLKLCTYLGITYPQLLDVKDNNGMNVLHAAAWGGNIDVLNFLIDKDFDINTKRNDGKNVLQLCSMEGHLDMCLFLAHTYPSLLDVKDNNGMNALHDAAWGGNVHLFQFLMEKDFDIEAKINDGKTVLHICCANGNQELCTYLCNIYPYLLDVKDNNGMNVLHAAAWGGNIDVLNFLIDKDFDIEAKRNDGKNVLHLCCISGKLDMCQYLINAYPRLLHVKDNNGMNALHDAAWCGNVHLFQFLIENDFDIEVKRKDGKTVLHLCCMNGKQDMCQYLLNAYPSLQDVKDIDGINALHDAAGGGNVHLFQFLMEKDFGIEAKINDGKTVLHICCANGNQELCTYLCITYPYLLDVKDNNGMNVLHAAAWGGNIDVLNFLIDKDFDIEAKRNDGKTVLHLCCMSGKLDMCQYLINAYPRLLHVKDNNGMNALHDAAWGGNVHLFQFLIEKDFDIEAKRKDGKTVLHLCCMNGKQDMCQYLLNAYPSLQDVKDIDGINALHDAAGGGNVHLFQFLMEKDFGIEAKINDGKTVLHICCANGNQELCTYLCITYPYLLDVKDNNGMNVLHSAVLGGNIDVLNFLIEKDFDIEAKRNDGKTVLHLCCMSGKLDMCQYLINAYPRLLHVKDNDGGNVLHDAAWGGNIDLLKFLIDKDFDIEAKRKDGKTVLHLCCMNGKQDMCQYLLNACPSLQDVKDNVGRTVLHDAAWGGNVDLFQFLIEKGFDIKAKSNDGETVIHLCCENGNLKLCTYLCLTYPQLLDVKDNNGMNVLHAAAWGGNIDLLNFLIEKVFDIEAKRKDGKTVLHLCCMNGKQDMCQYLLNAYPSLQDVKDNNGINALHDAAWGGNVHLFQFLMEKDFDIEAKINDGKTVLHICCANGNQELCAYLCNIYPYLLDVKDNNGMNVLHSAVVGGNIDILNFLKEKDFDIQAKRNDGKTVLHLCCMSGKLDMCQYLINAYPRLLHVKDNVGGNVLHAAAWGGNIDVLNFLIDKDFDIEAKRKDGKTVLHLCCMNGKQDMCQYLLNAYPSLQDVKDNIGRTVLHDAAWGGNFDLFQFLIEKGFDIEAKSNDGKTVIHLCCENGNLKLCTYLGITYPQLLDVKDNNGMNVLHAAAWGGNIDVLNFLIDKDFDINTKRNDGKNVLQICSMEGHLDMCLFLAHTYPNLLDVKDNNGMNALHDAAWGGNVHLFQFLMEKDFDIEAKINDGKTVLHICCANGNQELCTYLCNIYPYLLDVKDNNGMNVLHAAAWGGNIDVLNFLIDKDFDIEAKRNDGKNVLHLCCISGKLDMCQYLINAYPRLLHVKDNNGMNALHDAAWCGNVHLFQFLIENDFDIEVKRKDGKTVLHLCCMNGKQDMCQYLLNAYPSLQDVKDIDGINALHDAAWGGNVHLFQFLMEKDFDIEAKINDGKTVLHICCANGNQELCTYLCITYPYLLDVKDNTGMNVLHSAAWGGNIDVLNFLIEKDFDIEAKRNDGKTVLHLCCMSGKLDMCQYLINAYPRLLHVKDNAGGNVLHDAAWGGNIDVLNFLIDKDFDIEAKRKDGKTVLHLCCMNGKQDMCQYLLNAYPSLQDVKDNNGMNVLHYAAWCGNFDLFQYLIEKGFDIEAKSNDGKTVIHLCCENGNLKLCTYLGITYPHLLVVKDNNGMNVLHAAAWGGNIDVLNFLIDKDFDIEAKRNDGKNVLHLCCMSGKLDMCQYLINAYPRLLHVKDNNGMNALHDAAWSGNVDLFQFLIEKDFDIEAKRNDGKTVLHLCCLKGNLEMCKYLVNTYPHLLDVKDNNGENVLHDAAFGGNFDLHKFLSGTGLDIESKRNVANNLESSVSIPQRGQKRKKEKKKHFSKNVKKKYDLHAKL